MSESNEVFSLPGSAEIYEALEKNPRFTGINPNILTLAVAGFKNDDLEILKRKFVKGEDRVTISMKSDVTPSQIKRVINCFTNMVEAKLPSDRSSIYSRVYTVLTVDENYNITKGELVNILEDYDEKTLNIIRGIVLFESTLTDIAYSNHCSVERVRRLRDRFYNEVKRAIRCRYLDKFLSSRTNIFDYIEGKVSNRTFNCLGRYNHEMTVKEFLELDADEIKHIKCAGDKVLEEIEQMQDKIMAIVTTNVKDCPKVFLKVDNYPMLYNKVKSRLHADISENAAISIEINKDAIERELMDKSDIIGMVIPYDNFSAFESLFEAIVLSDKYKDKLYICVLREYQNERCPENLWSQISNGLKLMSINGSHISTTLEQFTPNINLSNCNNRIAGVVDTL